MSFRSASVSYARYRVRGGPRRLTADLLEALAENVVSPPSIGAPPEVQAGWTAGRHVFDTDFDPEENVFGGRLLVGLRLDTARVPAELRHAYRAMAERRRTPDPVLLGKRDRVDAREEAEALCRQELADGRHVRHRLVPVLWDVERECLLAPVFSDSVRAALDDLMGATFAAGLEPLSAGAMASDALQAAGRQRDYEDLAPSPFTPAPAAATSDDERDVRVPRVPWSNAGPEPKDFLGNEFIIWLWSRTERGSGMLDTERGAVGVAFDRVLDMDCAWEVTGHMSLRADGPTRLPEATQALRLGKWPRKVGLLLAADGQQWELSLQADRFLVTGARLPRPEDRPGSPRELIEHRLDSIDGLDRTLEALYATFLETRTGGAWSSTREQVTAWIRGRGRSAPAGIATSAVAV